MKPIAWRMEIWAGAALIALLGACANMQTGSESAKTEATGSAGGANSNKANKGLETCTAAMGTIAVVEDTSAPWYATLRSQQLGSTTPVLKLLIQQTHCFVIVERGAAMKNVMQERQLEQSGELRKKSSYGKGQLVSADYSLSPSITFANSDTGGGGAAAAGRFLPGPLSLLGGISFKSKEASTVLTLIDNRSGVQLAAAEGSAKNTDIGFLGGGVGGGMAGIGGGYSNTPEGKVIVAAFVDSLNGIVKEVKTYKAQHVKGGLGKGGKLKVQKD